MSVRRRAVSILALVLFTLAPATALAGDRGRGHGHGDAEAHRSLRQPVTDQNFYFVMADRFANGDTANDNGGLPPGTGAGQSGFEPKVKGFYHGGDLKGLTSKVDYIKGLGTTAIWLRRASRTRPSSPRTTRRATTATGSPTSPRSTRTWAPTRICARSSTPRTRAG